MIDSRIPRAATSATALIWLACALGACGGSNQHPSASNPTTTTTTQPVATTPSAQTAPATPPTAATTTPSAPANSQVPGSRAFKHEHAELVTLVACAREHGLNVPEPDAHNQIHPRGIDIHTPHFEEVSKLCLSKVGEEARAEQSKRH